MNTTLSFPIKGQTILNQAKDLVPGFAAAFQKFQQHIVLQQNSPSLLSNYSRNLAFLSIHFGKIPHLVSIDELNAYLYHLTISQGLSISYFKQTVFGLKYWFRVFDMEAHALKMPMIKKTETLPQVLSKQECKALFKAPTNLKHRFLLAFAYSAGLRMNELRHTKIADIDLDRMQIRVQKGKGNKDRYVVLAKSIALRLDNYLQICKPKVYLFEGLTPSQPMGERSIQYIINEAMLKTSIVKKGVSMHTLRHSFATHLLEDGIDVYSIQKLLGHADIRNTLVYLHVAQVKPSIAHSPLDTLYNKQ